MKKRTLIFKALVALLVIMLGVNLNAGAQSLLDLAARGINKAAEKRKAKKQAAFSDLDLPEVDEKGKPITFKWGNTAIGTWNPATFEIAFNQKYDEGSMKGKQVIYKVDPNTGNVTSNAGTAKGYMREGGEIESPNLGKLQVKKEGDKIDVYRNGKIIGHVNPEKAWGDAVTIGSFNKNVPVMLVAYVYYGCLTSELQTYEWMGEPIIPVPVKDAKPVTFKIDNEVFGTWNHETLKLTTNVEYKQGDLAGKKITLTVNPQTGKITNDLGSEIGTINNNGSITTTAGGKYTLKDRKVYFGNTHVGTIGNDYIVYNSYGQKIGTMDGYVSPLLASFVYFGVLYTEDDYARWKAEYEEAQAKAKAEAEQRAKEEAARQAQEKAKEKENLISVDKKGWTVGYVDSHGNVYDRYKDKIGKLPEGNGDILDKSGHRIGEIYNGSIKSGSTEICKVDGGYIYTKSRKSSSSVIMGDVRSSDVTCRKNRDEDNNLFESIGKSYINNKEWLAALIFCDFFF